LALLRQAFLKIVATKSALLRQNAREPQEHAALRNGISFHIRVIHNTIRSKQIGGGREA
jgi:hypothetical protein